jgi:hypothetical protein
VTATLMKKTHTPQHNFKTTNLSLNAVKIRMKSMTSPN